MEGVTIREVAARAGVSTSTVSNVLTGRRERMKLETFERVNKVIAELGYSPNLVARELKTGHVPVIGLIVPSIANPFWGSFAENLVSAAQERGCQVMLCTSDRDPAREQACAEALLARGIRGFILGSSPLSFDHLADLSRRGLKTVAFDRGILDSDKLEIDGVHVDNKEGALLATRHLLALGHRRIAFVCGPLGSCNRMERLEGYRAALREAGIEPDPDLLWTQFAEGQGGYEHGTEIGRLAAISLLRRAQPPTAFFAVNDFTALGVYAGARELGLRLPEDVSVVGFDDIGLCRAVDPALTTVRQPLEQLMREALNFLLSRLDGSLKGPALQVMLPPELVVRRSTAAPRA